MPQPAQHTLLEPEVALSVAADGVPREGRYATVYDDGSTGETQHMLYKDVGGLLHSVPIADWPTEQQALAAREAERQKHQAMNVNLRTAANAHRGKAAAVLTFPEIRDIMALWMDEKGLLDADGKIKTG